MEYNKDNRYDTNPDYNVVDESGICPVCGKEGHIVYGVFEIEGDGGYYPCSCSCGWKGREWYGLQFENFTDEE